MSIGSTFKPKGIYKKGVLLGTPFAPSGVEFFVNFLLQYGKKKERDGFLGPSLVIY